VENGYSDRQYDKFNDYSFYNFLKQIYYKLQITRGKTIPQKADPVPVCWLPTASPEFMVLEECWNISKNDLLVLTYYQSFIDFRKEIARYFRTKRFKLNIRII
jgi:hypothetical protein